MASIIAQECHVKIVERSAFKRERKATIRKKMFEILTIDQHKEMKQQLKLSMKKNPN